MPGEDDSAAGGGAPRRGEGQAPGLYHLKSNESSSSIFEDVEMAHDEVRTPKQTVVQICS